jgi:DNA-binding response OmpR family regulator
MEGQAVTRKKVLLIDDEKDFCYSVKRNLERTYEFEVYTANEVQEGIGTAKKEKPDIILLDIVMPNLCGPEIADLLTGDPETKRIPIVFLSTEVTGREIGGHDFIAKPVDTDDLITAIKLVLNRTCRE